MSTLKAQKRPARDAAGPVKKKFKALPSVPFDDVDTVEFPLRPTYIYENGLRKVEPYYFVFYAYAKRRWLSFELLAILQKEFHPRMPMDFAQSISLGRLTVNGSVVEPGYILKDNDLIEHVLHRHEAPVLSKPIDIVYEDANVLAVNKPCSIPVHSCGRYRHNTVYSILRWEQGYSELRTFYRLDRLTSGLLIFSKNLHTCQMFNRELRDNLLSKEYVCLVEGVFPSEPVTCDQSIDFLSRKMGLMYCTANGKSAKTVFERLGTNGTKSLVKCCPRTGRTHQIRVHLQYLGYPILHDNLYNSYDFGPQKGKNGDFGKSLDEVIADIWQSHKKDPDLEDTEQDERSVNDDVTCEVLSPTVHEAMLQQVTRQFDPFCPYCTAKAPLPDPTEEELTMYLHALRYKGPDWEYSVPMPSWALPFLPSDVPLSNI